MQQQERSYFAGQPPHVTKHHCISLTHFASSVYQFITPERKQSYRKIYSSTHLVSPSIGLQITVSVQQRSFIWISQGPRRSLNWSKFELMKMQETETISSTCKTEIQLCNDQLLPSQLSHFSHETSWNLQCSAELGARHRVSWNYAISSHVQILVFTIIHLNSRQVNVFFLKWVDIFKIFQVHPWLLCL